MRKRIVSDEQRTGLSQEAEWLDLEKVAQVELTSEDAAHPIESALRAGDSRGGWRAASPGAQTIRFIFDAPRAVSRIRLLFRDEKQERTLEFVLSYSVDGHGTFREILRQQYHFSPPGTTEELEDYHVKIAEVKALALVIVPDVGRHDTVASLVQIQIA